VPSRTVAYHIPEGAAGFAANTVQRLSAAGYRLEESHPWPAAAYHLFFFSQMNDAIENAVRECCLSGSARVLAIWCGSAPLDVSSSLAVLDAGATDTVWLQNVEAALSRISARLERWIAVDEIIDAPIVRNNLVGASRVWIATLRQIVEAAAFSNSPVLITGETGTGKEYAARLIHGVNAQTENGRLITLDCTTIVPELAGSEFFGHDKGAFTGAVSSREGAFALANSGTLFLDETGELPAHLQAQLLRVIQEQTFKPVGGNQWQHTTFRLVCATNRDLLQDVSAGKFRSDLYFRIAVCTIALPPLRERTSDILLLARHFLRALRPEEDMGFDDAVEEYLVSREYAGNVRDLKQTVARLAYRHVGPGPITMGSVPLQDRRLMYVRRRCVEELLENAIDQAVTWGADLKEIGRAATETAIRIAVQREEGNLQKAAKRLGVTDRMLQMRRARSAAA
jgi:transcriptional regulator with GAF, ATPase, and Fis domain